MRNLSDQGQEIARRAAERHGVSPEAAAEMLRALAVGHGNQAQFSHPELGGMGQWSRGGMLMIGDMFNNALKARVDALANDLAFQLGGVEVLRRAEGTGFGFASGPAWPAEFGSPSSSGAQNDMRYAFFPETRRLAIVRGGEMEVYDSGEHRITGAGQQQGGGQTLSFSTPAGPVSLSDLRRIDRSEAPSAPSAETPPETSPRTPPAAPPEPPAAAGAAPMAVAMPSESPRPASSATSSASAAPSARPSGGGHHDIFDALERLADLKARGILTEEEFAEKKRDLLARI